MDQINDKIWGLILKDLRGELSEEESRELAEWRALSELNERWYQMGMSEENAVDMAFFGLAATKKEGARIRAITGAGSRPASIFRLTWFRSVAAAIVVLVSVAGLVWLLGRHVAPAGGKETAVRVNDLPPGGNKAILTLANGSRIVLDSAGNGALASQGNTQVIKLDSGQIAYRAAGDGGTAVLYNTISTPRGGQYKIVLPDNSRVWLNAATTLRFPAAFTGSGRSVELMTGEAYFEVAHNAGSPFTVRVPASQTGGKDAELQVLGTEFDLNAYPDEPDLKATLLSGSVRVIEGEDKVLLRPGEQAQVGHGSGVIRVETNVNTAAATAWKDGFFSFDRAGTEAVMRQLSRWYDVEVTYEGAIPPRQFVGTIPRNVPASDVLKALELNKVHFRIDGKKIVVQP